MKKIALIACIIFVACSANAQNDNKKVPSFGFYIFANDFETAADLRHFGLSEVLKQRNYFDKTRLQTGFAVSYLEGMTDHIDIAATLSGSFLSYPVPDKPYSNRQYALLDLTMKGNFKLVSDNHIINPFLTAGIGVSNYGSYFAAILPLGAGIQVKISKNIFALYESQYRVPVTASAAYHLNHYLGIVTPIANKKEPEPLPVPVIPVVTDRDADGVLDAQDACPDLAGLPSLGGCPDKDGDGVADKDDKCPEVAGLIKYGGCPIPDTDMDGINDEADKCPAEKGYARYKGCPVPDSDKDGVNDETDKCPEIAGSADNNGCPKLETFNFKSENVQFISSSDVLTKDAMTELDKLVKVLNDYPKLNINIDGHSDNTGKAETNLTLSQNRANAVVTYLQKAGIAISRMKATGYGQTKPVADNNTSAGRSLNRRVEFSVREK